MGEDRQHTYTFSKSSANEPVMMCQAPSLLLGTGQQRSKVKGQDQGSLCNSVTHRDLGLSVSVSQQCNTQDYLSCQAITTRCPPTSAYTVFEYCHQVNNELPLWLKLNSVLCPVSTQVSGAIPNMIQDRFRSYRLEADAAHLLAGLAEHAGYLEDGVHLKGLKGNK